MKKNIILWILALIITLAAGVYQRKTGPTYPVDGSVDIGGTAVKYSLPCTHGGDGDAVIAIAVGSAPIGGSLHYKHHKADEPFTDQPMQLIGDSLKGYLPHQPAAGKLEYFITLTHNDAKEFVPGPKTVVIRFRGDVPAAALIPHIFCMFLGMLWSNRAGLEALSADAKTKSLTVWTIILMFVGGMILGPLVQKYAFGSYWSGVPFGYDLTDNKTLLFIVVWAVALWRHRVHPRPRYIVLAAAIITLVMYLIPHSMLGSTLDHTTGQVTSG